ncbi:hypothetical protein LOTGIDRAFT_135405 [Lottia gigantea]|uniref:Telomere-associated protein Rif1 N-terminal domain-containing protein n=1 Tax=Lottia gigantea TaxID=225164 RepID=V4B1I7_LOTGI|nr:hypothetical protein LOTGIDRAFT_135405 [Lottia gigantea]ESO82094.1 hypothetical protein LOTGIDRAFT_135405 [Lottia gigantea]
MKWEKICFSLLIHPSCKKISGELKKLFNNNEQFVLKVWCFLVKYFGEELHQGSFINSLLPLVEMGFKTLEPDVKLMSFKAWKELINNFAMNPSKYAFAREKFETWIYYICKLGVKASVNFDQVVVPLLQFCTGGNKLNTSTSFISTPTTPRFGVKNTPISIVSPTTPRLSITSTPSQLPTFKTLQLKGVEILAQILGMSNYNYTTGELSNVTMPDIISSPMFFLKQSSVLISCLRELVMSLGNEIPEDLLLATWSALVGHVNVAVDITPKSDHREMFSYFLSQFQFIALVENIAHLLLRMFDSVCNIPLKVLSSNVYSVGMGHNIDVFFQGTPALFLCEILLSPILMQSLAQNERYMTIYGKLVNCGFTITTGTLQFSQSVVDIIDRHSQYLPNIESLWRLWSVIANRLLEHIIKTSEINQGDSLEYDFTCLYTALILPIKHKIGSKVSQAVCKSVMKTWSDLYRCFSRQAALVTTAEDNVVCEDFCSRIINSLSTEEFKPSLIDFIVQVLLVVLDCVNFSALSGATAFNLTGSFSPGKRWMKHKQKPLENLHSFLHLFTDLLNNSIDIAEHTLSVTVAINGLVDIVTTMVTHTTNSNIISNMFHKIAEPVSRLYSSSTNKNGTKLYTSAFYQKLEKLWLDISTCLQSRYTSIYDSDFLAKISTLLEATFLHPRRPIKNQTILFWNTTFSKSSTLTYPDNLKKVLVKVKEKTPINLPGWVNVETTIIDDTPVSQSQFSQVNIETTIIDDTPVSQSQFSQVNIETTIIDDTPVSQSQFSQVNIETTIIDDTSVSQSQFSQVIIETTIIDDTPVSQSQFRQVNIETIIIDDTPVSQSQFSQVNIETTIIDDTPVSQSQFSQVNI